MTMVLIISKYITLSFNMPLSKLVIIDAVIFHIRHI